MSDLCFRCFSTPPSMRNRRSQFCDDFNGFPILFDFQSISIDFLSFSISFSQFQSVLINVNQFQSVWFGQKRRNLLTTGRWGKQHVICCLDWQAKAPWHAHPSTAQVYEITQKQGAKTTRLDCWVRKQTLSFFSLVFLRNQGKPRKHQGFSDPANPFKSLLNKQKTFRKTK